LVSYQSAEKTTESQLPPRQSRDVSRMSLQIAPELISRRKASGGAW